MALRKRWGLIICLLTVLLTALAATGIWLAGRHISWGYAREVSPAEQALRQQVIRTAESWLGCNEGDGSHKEIIDIYNQHEPLAVNYKVNYTDKWCATFGSTVAIVCDLTDIIPTECGCQRQIDLFRHLGCWQEDEDAYIPLPGDYIYYSTQNPSSGDSTGWSDHVGIVVGTWNNYIKVIEGNNGGKVDYRILSMRDPTIRGYATPDYSSAAN